MLGAPNMLFPFIIGVPIPTLYLPLLGALTMIFSLFGKCTADVLREKKHSRPFLKVDEVVVYPYYLGEVAFHFLDPLGVGRSSLILIE